MQTFRFALACAEMGQSRINGPFQAHYFQLLGRLRNLRAHDSWRICMGELGLHSGRDQNPSIWVLKNMNCLDRYRGRPEVWLANCYFDDDSSGFPILLRFCNAQSSRSFHSLHLSLPKMLPGANAFEISDIQGDETEASQPDAQNVTMLYSLEHRCWKFLCSTGERPVTGCFRLTLKPKKGVKDDQGSHGGF